MNIINLNLRKSAAILGTAAILALGYGMAARADHTDIHISPAANGSVIQESNTDADVVASFSPDLDLASSTAATLQANATTSVTGYYGVSIESATTTGDVYWRITVSHATESLTGGISITEKGYFDADSGVADDSAYASAVSSGDIVFTGNAGWEVFDGDEFTNVDAISFDSDAPLGVYTVTRALIDNSTSTDPTIDSSFSFTINLVAAADITPPDAPVVSFPPTPHSTSTNPISVYGTAEADSTISITGGASTSTATTTAGGSWNASVNLTASSTNVLLVKAADASGNVSIATTLTITHSSTITATSSPIITLSGDATTTVFACNGFVEPGFSAVNSAGASISATSTGTVGTDPGTYVITYTAVDAEGHTATTTRTVNVIPCSSGGGGAGGRSNAPFITVTPGQVLGDSFPPGPPIATPPVQFIANPGGFVPQSVIAGQVLGASSFRFDNNLRVGMRGQDVIELQTRLTATGYYSGPITGYFGPLTRAAVVRFQAAHGLPQTGFVGPMTRAILNS